MGACLFMFFFCKRVLLLYICVDTQHQKLLFLSFYFFFKIVFSFLSFSRHVTNLCGDLPRSAICKLEHSSYEKLFLRKFRNKKKTRKIPLWLEDKACFLTLACLHLEVFSVQHFHQKVKFHRRSVSFARSTGKARKEKRRGPMNHPKSKIKRRYKITISMISFNIS